MPTIHTTQLNSGHHLSRSSSEMSLSSVDLESGVLDGKELRLCDNKADRDCRICHLGLESNGHENGLAIELGCSCKGDLGSAHNKCAETWFKIKGNTICEICGATALNIAGQQENETHGTAAASAAVVAPTIPDETRTFWHSRRIMNLLLACMVFAFVVSWLFHFKILS